MKKGKPRKKPPSFRQKMDVAVAQAGLRDLPIPALVATISTIIDILRDRGVEIRDWDDKAKVVYKLSVIGGKVYILAPREKPKAEAQKHGEFGDEEQVK